MLLQSPCADRLWCQRCQFIEFKPGAAFADRISEVSAAWCAAEPVLGDGAQLRVKLNGQGRPERPHPSRAGFDAVEHALDSEVFVQATLALPVSRIHNEEE
jgi:hypothetical protein